jgi:hypothetical protein
MSRATCGADRYPDFWTLSQGVGLEYEDRGVRELNGIPEPRHVFAVA